HRQHPVLRGGGEVGLEAGLLRRADRRGHEARVAVQHDDVPGAELVAVVTLGRIAGGRAEVAEIARGGGARVVVVVARHRIGTGLVAPPARVVAVLVVGGGAVGIAGVAQREHGAGDAVEQGGGGLVVGAVAARDVARPYQRDTRRRLRDGHGRGCGARGAVLVRDG